MHRSQPSRIRWDSLDIRSSVPLFHFATLLSAHCTLGGQEREMCGVCDCACASAFPLCRLMACQVNIPKDIYGPSKKLNSVATVCWPAGKTPPLSYNISIIIMFSAHFSSWTHKHLDTCYWKSEIVPIFRYNAFSVLLSLLSMLWGWERGSTASTSSQSATASCSWNTWRDQSKTSMG